jgi:hypothetical protein
MKHIVYWFLAVFAAATVAFAARWPVGGNPSVSPPKLTDPFGPRLRSSGAYDFHMGVDIGVPHLTPICAPFSGQVEDRRWYAGYGNTLWVSHVESFDSFYAHMDDVGHAEGPVSEGEVIGNVGNTGGNYGYHLHFARYDGLLSYPWTGSNRIWVHPAHDLPYYNAAPDSGPHNVDSSYFADNESLSVNGHNGLEAHFNLHIPARSFSFLSLHLRIFNTFELLADYSLEDFLQHYDYDSTTPPSGWEELQTVTLHATTIADHHPPGTLTFYPQFYQSSQWPHPAHQTIEFVFVWPEVQEDTRAAVESGTASWSVEVVGPNYGTQAYFEWQTSSTDIAKWELPSPSIVLQAWPNPFNGVAQITYCLPANAPVTLTIFDLLGRRVDAIQYPVQISGWHRTSWQPDHLASGIYFVRLEAGGEARIQKVQLVK